MHWLLAYADVHESSEATLRVMLFTALCCAGIAIMAMVVIIEARRRGHRYAHLLTIAALFWALLAGASAYQPISQRDQWTQEEMVRIQTGYYDPQAHQRPALPWALWAALGAAYAGIVVWSLTGKAAPGPEPTQPPSPEPPPTSG